MMLCAYKYSIGVTFETFYFTYFGYLISDRLGASWRGPSVHAAILDTNTKHSDLFIRSLIRFMYMVESEDIDILNLNSLLINLVVL